MPEALASAIGLTVCTLILLLFLFYVIGVLRAPEGTPLPQMTTFQLGLAVGIPLIGFIYFLVRFVKWAWYAQILFTT